ncbi:MAG TPA: hypothetical protein PK978_07565, partial [Paludibacter sp.]|nr:hypothetical protein [Paludibacter sp.]
MKRVLLYISFLLILFPQSTWGQQLSTLRYWFNDDAANLHEQQFNYVMGAEVDVDLDASTLLPGLHTVTIQVARSNGVYSPAESALFMKISEGSHGKGTLYYWFDAQSNHLESIAISSTSDETSLMIPTADLPEGLHRLNAYIISEFGERSSVVSELFLKLSLGSSADKRTIHYWFDDKPASLFSIDVPSTTSETNLMIPTTDLSDGLHRLNAYIVDESGERSSVFSGLFLKVPSGNSAHKVVSVKYWFNDKSWATQEIPISNPSSLVEIITEIPVTDLQPGENTLHLAFENSVGFKKYEEHQFLNKVGTENKLRVLKLEPNINSVTYLVKEYATVHLYYQIIDNDDKPVQGVKVEYLLEGKNQKFVSAPSDAMGVVDIAIPVWGNDINDPADDWIPLHHSDKVVFSRLLSADNTEIDVWQNEFNRTLIQVDPYKATKKTIGILTGFDFSTKILEEGISFSTKGQFKNENKAQLTFDYSGYGISEIEYKVKSDLKSDFSVSPGMPPLVVKGGAGANYKTERTIKLMQNADNPLLYLVMLRDLLSTNKKWLSPGNQLFTIALDYLISNKVDTTQSVRKYMVETKLSGGAELDFSFAKLKGESSMGISAGHTTKLRGSAITSYSDDLELSIESGSNLEIGDPNGFSLGGGMATESSVSLSRELESGTEKLMGGKVKSEYKRKVEGELKGAVELMAFGLNLEWSKTAVMENKFGTNFLNSNFSNTTNAPLSLQYMLSPPVTVYFNKVRNETNEIPTSYLVSQPIQQTQSSLKEDIVTTFSKEYEGVGKISFGLNFDFGLLNLKLLKNIGGFYKNEFTIAERYYHADTKQHLSLIEYKDTDKTDFFDSPIFKWQETVNEAIVSFRDDLTRSIKSVSNIVSDITGSIKRIFTNDTRQYSPVLSRYARLRSAPQVNRSILSFEIPGEEKAFNANTEFNFNYYYPGGDLLGTTMEKDTFLVISDVFFLQAIHSADTLLNAPNGTFSLTNSVGAEDLSVFDLAPETPVSVYYKPLDEDNWQNLGVANSSIQVNGLGVYTLGIGMKADTISPTIVIDKPENENILSITVKDNIGIQWKSVSIIVNGIARQYEKSNNSLAVVNLEPEEEESELYVSVVAYDLAGNKTSRYREFRTQPISISVSINTSLTGTITGDGDYTYGSDCELTAHANKGYSFLNWTENGLIVSTDTIYTFIVDTARTLVANFAINKYNITITTPTDGTLKVYNGEAEIQSGTQVEYGTKLRIEAVPDTGCRLVSLQANGENITNDTVTITETTEIKALFE